MHPKLTFTDLKRQRFSSIHQSFEGAEAIYAERPAILHGRVAQVSFNDWGAKARITDLRSPGMHRVPQNPLEISMAWEVFSFNESDWDTPNILQCRFRPFFHPIVLRPAIELAAKKANMGKRIGWDEFLPITRQYYHLREKE
jgi:hypothetical protein